MKNLKLWCASAVAAGMMAGAVNANAQEEEKKVTVYGNVQNNMWYNTRQSGDLRDGIFNLLPADAGNLNTHAAVAAGSPVQKTTADDSKAIGNIGYSAIFSRLGVKFNGGTAFGAKLSGLIEGDFFGVTNMAAGSTSGVGNSQAGTEQLFRLRHAAVDLDWAKTQLKVGQYWNPNFTPECFPTTPNFALAINPFSFIPQVRVTHKITKEVSVMAMTHMNSLQGFSSAVSAGVTNNNGVAMGQLSQMPSFAAQVKYDNGMIMGIVGAELNFLRPNTSDTYSSSTGKYNATGELTKNITTNLTTYNLMARLKVTLPQLVTVKVGADYGQNYTQYVGYGAAVQYRDANSGELKYQAVNIMSSWAELICTKHPMFQPALFVGYLKNLGLGTELSTTEQGTASYVYARGIGSAGTSIGTATTPTRVFDSYFRVAPRLDIISGKYKIAVEYEYGTAIYGDANLANLKIADSTAGTSDNRKFIANNNRITASVIYSF